EHRNAVQRRADNVSRGTVFRHNELARREVTLAEVVRHQVAAEGWRAAGRRSVDADDVDVGGVQRQEVIVGSGIERYELRGAEKRPDESRRGGCRHGEGTAIVAGSERRDSGS